MTSCGSVWVTDETEESLASSLFSPPRCHSHVAGLLQSDCMVVCGGHRWDTPSTSWGPIAALTKGDPAASGEADADTASQVGGRSTEATWECSLATKLWVPRWDRGAGCPATGLVGSSCVSHNSRLYVWGGFPRPQAADAESLVGTVKSDEESERGVMVWVYYGTGVWRGVKTKNSPPVLSGHYAFVHQECMYTYGGFTTSGACADLYQLNLETMKWCQLHPIGICNFHPNFTASYFMSRLFVLFFPTPGSKQELVSLSLDPEHMSWEALPLPTNCLLEGVTAIAFSDCICFIGASVTFLYFPLTRLWFHIELEGSRYIPISFASTVQHTNTAWIFGGSLNSTTSTSTLLKINYYGGVESGTPNGDFIDFPGDILAKILSYLGAGDLGRVLRVSRNLRRIGIQPHLWKPHVAFLVHSEDTMDYYEQSATKSRRYSFWKEVYYQLSMKRESVRIKGKPESIVKPIHANYSEGVKVSFLGSCGVGKSALAILLATDKFVENWDSDIDDTFSRSMTCPDSTTIKWIIYDTTDEFAISPFREYDVTRADAWVFLYSITDMQSFKNLAKYIGGLRRIRDMCSSYPSYWPALIICGTKVDLEPLRQVPRSDGIALSKTIGCSFIEISSRTRTKTDSFMELVLYELNRCQAAKPTSQPIPQKDKCSTM